MKILLQHTLLNPADWVELDVTPTGQGARRWRDLAKKTAGPVDNAPGYIMALNVQGVEFAGFDFYAAEPIANGGLRVYGWTTTVGVPPTGSPYRQAEVWEFHLPKADLRFGGQVNTVQTRTVFTESPEAAAALAGSATSGGVVVVRPWAEFAPPPEHLTRYGIAVSSELLEAHRQSRSTRGWREWVA